MPPVSGALAGILITLLLYKVGHPQFFLVVPLAAGLWFAIRRPYGARLLSCALVTSLGWIAAVSALYLLTRVHGLIDGGFSGAFIGPMGFSTRLGRIAHVCDSLVDSTCIDEIRMALCEGIGAN